MMTTTIRYSEIPSFLQGGEFYRALCSEEQSSEIEIPEKCYCQTADRVETILDFVKLLKTAAFWGLPLIPVGLIKYCDTQDSVLWKGFIDRACSEMIFAKELRLVFDNKWEKSPIMEAMHIGRTEIVEYLAPKKSDTSDATRVAAELGRIDYLELLREHGHPWDESVCNAAARKGHLTCLQYLIDNKCAWNDNVLVAALQSGNHNIIKYVLSKDIASPANVATNLARQGSLELLQSFVRHNCVLNAEATTAAAKQGHILCLQYLLEIGCPADSRACLEACRNGHLNCLQLLHSHHVPWDEGCSGLAARFGMLDILQYLHINGCPWDVSTPELATTNCHVHCLRFLLDIGCPFDERIINIAAESFKDQSLCFRYLVEDYGAYLNEDGSLFVHAFTSANLDAVQYLLDQGCPYQNCSKATQERCIALLKRRNCFKLYDAKLLKCVKVARHFQWDMLHCNAIVTSYINVVAKNLPLCSTYLCSEGIMMVPEDSAGGTEPGGV